jgi:hypothetical protein
MVWESLSLWIAGSLLVEISKAGDVNETRIWTEQKNVLPLLGARCATVFQGYVVFRHVVNHNGWLLGTLITYV